MREMRFEPLPISGAYRVDIEKRSDDRGFFARTFCANEFAQHRLNTTWAQMNTSVTRQMGAIRGMHFQRPPFAEEKFIRCLKGAVLDVIVDLRRGSSSYGKWCSLELSEENRSMIYIPQGCAHGFQTLAEDTELLYLHSQFYNPESEGGLNFSDPDVAITWPLPVSEISLKDRNHPSINQLDPIVL